MNAKLGWTGFVVAACLLVWSGTLHSQPEKTPELGTLDLLPGETEETILKEKVEALEKIYQQTVAQREAAHASQSDVVQAGSQLSLAKADLAAAAGEPEQQIKHLQEALKFADDRVKIEGALRLQGRTGGSKLMLGAVLQRADVKLALLRAKQKQKSR